MYRFTVEEIKFNHDTTSCSADAVTIRLNARKGFDTSHGEWWTGGTPLKNDPVCYVGGVVPTVKARIRVSPQLFSARISASVLGLASPLSDLVAQTVTFSNGLSDWIEFHTGTAIERRVRRIDHSWLWMASQLNGNDTAAFPFHTTGPHRIYTVITDPATPWIPNSQSRQNPWVDALELACSTANGKSDKVEALADVAFHLFYSMEFRYDTNNGDPNYFDGSSFDLSSYLLKRKEMVNCSDQAYGLATLGNLLGIYSTPVFTRPFGYINVVNLVGVGPCNNPFYTDPATQVRVRIAGQDDADRSTFSWHMYVFAEGVIFDACAGAELGTKGHAEYLRSMIDTSTAEETERSFFAPFNSLGVLPEIAFETHEYKIH